MVTDTNQDNQPGKLRPEHRATLGSIIAILFVALIVYGVCAAYYQAHHTTLSASRSTTTTGANPTSTQ
jgi:hypothetical protein